MNNKYHTKRKIFVKHTGWSLSNCPVMVNLRKKNVTLHLLEMGNITDQKKLNKELAANFIHFYENFVGWANGQNARWWQFIAGTYITIHIVMGNNSIILSPLSAFRFWDKIFIHVEIFYTYLLNMKMTVDKTNIVNSIHWWMNLYYATGGIFEV